MENSCIQITCYDENGNMHQGTGTCFRSASPNYDLVLTAGHCIPNLDPKAISIPEIKVIAAFRPEKYEQASVWDFGVIIVKKLPEEISAFAFAACQPCAESSCRLWGYPQKKQQTENPWHVVDAVYNRGDANQQILRLVGLEESSDHSCKQLLEGMSGGPIVVENNGGLAVCGIFTHTLLNNGEYHEICAVNLDRIIQWLRQTDLVYLDLKTPSTFYVFEEMVDREWGQAKETNRISAILIGKSGAGKSAFAKTLLKNASKFDPTGQTRTTRSTIKYNISLYCKEPKVCIKFFNKSDFVAFRLRRCIEILDSSNCVKKDPETPSLSAYSLTFSDLINYAFANDTFFNYLELSYLDEKMESAIREAIERVFPYDDLEEIPSSFTKDNYMTANKRTQDDDTYGAESKEKSVRNDYTLDDMVSLVFEKIYELAFSGICNHYRLNKNRIEIRINQADEKLLDLVNCSLKVIDGKSLTGLIETVTIEDRVSDEFIPCFQTNQLHTLTLLDTYGLDHMAILTLESLEQRLWELNSQHPDTESIFYIRKLGTDAPSDLESIIPKIYSSNPTLKVYMIFTGIDENQLLNGKYDNKVIPLSELNKEKRIEAVDYFNLHDNKITRTIHPICKALMKSGISVALSNSIYQNMKENLVPYCACENASVRNNYLINNVFYIQKLLKSIVNKDYLGNGLIHLKHIERCFSPASQPEKVKEKLLQLLENFFNKATIRWYEGTAGTGNWRTQQANITRLQNGTLGYWGTYNHQWNERFFSSYNQVFSKLSKEDLSLLFSTDKELQDAVAIQQMINSFGRSFLKCYRRNDYFTFPANDEYCKDCAMSRCFRAILLRSYQPDELKQPVSASRSSWLNERCDFKMRFQKIRDAIYYLFIRAFNETVIPQMKAHNARKAAEFIENDSNAMEHLKELKILINDRLESYEKEVGNERVAEIVRAVKTVD